MLSLIRNIPTTVLERVTFLVAAHDTCRPPTGLVQLLLTCRYIRQILHPTTSSQLYGWLFAAYFDPGAARRRLHAGSFTELSLFEELRRRFQILRMIREGYRTEINYTAGLFTVLIMTLEDDGLNSLRLKAANTSSFLFDVIRKHACTDESRTFLGSSHLVTVAIWSLWYMTTRRQLFSMSLLLLPRRSSMLAGAVEEEEEEDDQAIMIVKLFPMISAAFTVRIALFTIRIFLTLFLHGCNVQKKGTDSFDVLPDERCPIISNGGVLFLDLDYTADITHPFSSRRTNHKSLFKCVSLCSARPVSCGSALERCPLGNP